MQRPRAGTRCRHNHCCSEVRGKSSPRKEVGTMGYLVMGIAYIVLAVIAAAKPRAGHA
ncbi:MAG: hypothetical protein ACYC37_02430 [Desulfobacteria bacterium]